MKLLPKIALLTYLFLAAHEFEGVDLLQLGDDELAPHVVDLHLEVVDLEVAHVNLAFGIVLGAFRRYPPAKKRSTLFKGVLSQHPNIIYSLYGIF